MTIYWCGTGDATSELHDECCRRYTRHCPGLAACRFEVREDLGDVRIVLDPEAANGIWTLAEIRAGGADWSEVAAVAARMRAAIERARQERKR